MDTVGNMLTSIVNAQRIGKERVVVPYSKFTYELAKMLQEEGLVAKCRVQASPKKSLIIKLVYENGEPKIKRVKRVSKLGSRKYVSRQELPFTGNKPGILIISTSHGLMNQNKARKQNLGGELIGEIWCNN
jgi:small subunit ribosomal protein S8